MNLASGDDGYHDSLLQLLRFKSISTDKILSTFVGFQKHLYQRPAA